jgi:hypothetical protein
MGINRGLSQSGNDMQEQADCADKFCQPGRLGAGGEIFHTIIIAPLPISGRAKSLLPELKKAHQERYFSSTTRSL